MLINEIGDYEKANNPKQTIYQPIILKTNIVFSSKSQSNDIADLIKCISDVKPVVEDVMALVDAYRKGDVDKSSAALKKLASDAYTAGVDCAKLFTNVFGEF